MGTTGARVVCSESLDNVVFNEWVGGPTVDRQEAVAAGYKVGNVTDCTENDKSSQLQKNIPRLVSTYRADPGLYPLPAIKSTLPDQITL